ncbi:MAG: NrfD/PsrC family molybdoenzyme membrane anchor subunit [Anaerolineales bacterium]|jgi:molybdopterin-containing oxidoreductase family membrane subunit
MAQDSMHLPVWKQPFPEDSELAAQAEELRREHLLLDARPPKELADRVLTPMARLGWVFWLVFVVLAGALLTWLVTWTNQMFQGLGVVGYNRVVMWAPYIINFVYFIGIGHAGTFISAALRVLRFDWRAPISRAAETLTIFALAAAGSMPLIHLGRAWKAYWLIPYPNERGLWPDLHSPLLWDMIAIFTYLSCSLLFEYLGLLPDLAMAREYVTGWRKRFYTLLSLGWRGSGKQWKHLDTAQNVFSYAIIPVMFSVHTIVSWDFAMTLQPEWHSSIFGPYFVVGALFSGVGAVIIVLAVLRKALHLEYYIRAEHFNGMGKFLLVLSLTWAYFYFNSYIVPWYGQDPASRVILQNEATGWAAPLWYLMLFSNIVVPWATLWSKKLRTSIPVIVGVSIFVQIGMYIERYLIVAMSLGYNYLPFNWLTYTPQLTEILITIGAFSLVTLGVVLTSRLVPIIPVWEVKEGQRMQGMRRIGRAMVQTRTEPE